MQQARRQQRKDKPLQASVLSHKFLVFQSSQNAPVQGALRREYLDIRQERNTGFGCARKAFSAAQNPPCGSACPVMAHSVNSRRARPARLLAVLQPLAMEWPLPADCALPETLQAALKC
jgi:hypothetical protein